MISIKEFCKKNHILYHHEDWMVENCGDMKDAWYRGDDDLVFSIATSFDVLNEYELHHFAIFCLWQMLPHLDGNCNEARRDFLAGEIRKDDDARKAAFTASLLSTAGIADVDLVKRIKKERTEYLRKNCRPNFHFM